MAVVTINTGFPHYFKGFQDSFLIGAKKSISAGVEEEDRGFDGCAMPNVVTAYPTDSNDTDKNDYSQALFRLSTTSDTIKQELWRNGVKVADINDDTYGRYWDIGDITYYAGQELQAGCEISWLLVYNAFGVGNYQIKTEITPLVGDVISVNSVMYKLFVFDGARMNGSIRIESLMNGTTERNGIIYKGLNIKDVTRLPGIITEGQEEWEQVTDIYENERNEVVRRSGKIDTFDLTTLPIPKCMSVRLTDYHAFADDLYISDYNIGNFSYDIIRKNVVKADAFDTESVDNQNRKVSIKGKFKEKQQNNIKIVNF